MDCGDYVIVINAER
ncbi:MAG: hypothetical protein ACLU5I_07240 [Alistipes finegoldii]